MPDERMTRAEVVRRFDQIDGELGRVGEAVDTMTGKLVADFYHLADIDRRVGRLEKLLTGVAVAMIGIVVDLLVRH